MITLLKKDLLIQKRNLVFLVFYSIFMFIAFNNPQFKDMIYSMGLLTTVYIFLTTANMEDEKNKSAIMLNSLPLHRNQLVLAKYLSVLVYLSLGAGLWGGLGLLFQLPAIPITPRLLSPMDLLVASFLVSICISIYFPLYFRFGASSLRFFSVIFFLFFFFLPRLLLDLYHSYQDTMLVHLLQNYILRQPPLLQLAVAVAIMTLLLTGSYLLSCQIYSHREF